jgi:hypothetical protein
MFTERPAVPEQAYRTERAWIALRNVFDALAEYEAISNRDYAPAALAGWCDIAAAVSAVVFGAGDLAAALRGRRDKLVEDARIAQAPQRRRRKASESSGIKKVS